ncbi:MAG: protein kinase [Planctomycetes bacterium]|nr:protein kinase [Planctomycetota bacterium]
MGVDEPNKPGNEPTSDLPANLRGRGERVPETIGGFRIRRLIASGGMGLVYEAIQDSPHRSIALKVMRHGASTPSALKRFRNEAQLMARLHHPGIAQVYEAGVDESGPEPVPFIAMELVVGARTLRDYVRKNALNREAVIELIIKAAEAVAHGNSKGVIHRDLKPTNILVDPSGQVKIIDFGVARAIDGDAPMTQLTELGQLVGTVQYMSPEQISADSRELDERADVYSLGVILYELIAGKPPHDLEGKSVYEAAIVVRDNPSSKLGTVASGIPLDLETIVNRAVEHDRDRRYQTAQELANDLQRFLNGQPIQARRDSAWYVFVKSSRAWVAANRGLYVAAAVAFVAAISYWGGTWLLFKRTNLARVGEMPLLAATPSLIDRLDHVSLITMTQGIDVEDLAARTGVDGVKASNLRSVRRLHGKLMERLAEVGPRVVVWDIRFVVPSPADDVVFLKGVDALARQRIPVVTALLEFTPRTPEWYAESSSIMRHPNVYAGEMLAAKAKEPIEFPTSPISLRRGDAEPWLSGPVLAWAAGRRPGSGFRSELSLNEDFFELKWFDRDAEGRTGETVRLRERIPQSFIKEWRQSVDGEGVLGENDRDIIAYRSIEVPTLAQLDAATTSYSDALTMDLATLTSRVTGKIVVIGNDTVDATGKPADARNVTRHGETVPGSRLVASAIEGLFRDRYLSFVSVPGAIVITLASGILAVFVMGIAVRMGKQPWFGAACGSGAILALLVVMAVIACRFVGVIVNPIVPVICGVLSCAAALPAYVVVRK